MNQSQRDLGHQVHSADIVIEGGLVDLLQYQILMQTDGKDILVSLRLGKEESLKRIDAAIEKLA